MKMLTTILTVGGMSCEHCVKAITNAIGVLSGVYGVSVDLTARSVTVEYEPNKTSIETIKFEIEDQGYEVIV